MHKIILLFLLSLILLAGCSKSTAPDPNAEIIMVEVADDPVFTNYATTIKVVLQDSLASNQHLALELQQPDGSNLDTLINRDTFFWVAPDQSGEYEHHIWIETEEGKVISETKSIEIEVIPWEGSDSNQLEGKLVFEDYAGDWLQIFSMNVDGSDLQQLTHFENEDCYEPAWSPDGKNVAFISSKGGTSLGGVLWIMKADGSESRMIRPNENGFGINANFPSWSPDGRKIAFQKCYGCPAGVNYEIYVYDFESENIIKLTDENGYDTRPDWSPDGRRILFSSGRDYINADSARYRSDFYSINIDGSGLKRQSRHGNVSKPVWSPDGKIVVFDWYSDNRFDVYTQNLNDLTRSKISNPDLRDVHNPIWSTNNLNLVVFGKTWDSNDQIIRFYKIDENGTTVIQTIILEGITSGNNYDWIETQ